MNDSSTHPHQLLSDPLSADFRAKSLVHAPVQRSSLGEEKRTRRGEEEKRRREDEKRRRGEEEKRQGGEEEKRRRGEETRRSAATNVSVNGINNSTNNVLVHGGRSSTVEPSMPFLFLSPFSPLVVFSFHSLPRLLSLPPSHSLTLSASSAPSASPAATTLPWTQT